MPRRLVCHSRLCLVIALLVVVVAPRVSAFESDEHQWLTESALCVVEHALADTERQPDQVPRVVMEALRAVAPSSEYCSTAPLTLGRVTVYADFVSAPRRLLRTDRHGAARLDTQELCMRAGAFVLGATEMIRNPHHFGREGLLEYYAWHEHALLLAARAGRLARSDRVAATNAFTDAVILESYAIHFLQDFFAPGHVDVMEPSISISATLARHDRINLEGRDFHLAGDWPAVQQKTLRRAARCLRLGPEAMLEATDGFPTSAGESTIRLEGDNRLFSATMGKVYRPVQAMFITLASSLSIRDLVTLFDDPDADWVATLTFPPVEGPIAGKGFGIEPFGDGVCAWLPIGYYDTASDAPPNGQTCGAQPPAGQSGPKSVDATVEPAERVTSSASSASPVPTPTRLLQKADDPIGFGILTRLPRTAIDVTVDRLNEGSRKTVAGELFLDWWTISPVEYQTLEWSLGYTYVRGNAYEGQGFDVRAYYRFKNLYVWTSLGAGWRFLHSAQGDGNAPTVGGRVGFGPEILSVFTGVAVDSSLEHGRIEIDPLSFEFGVQSILPWQRFGGIVEEWFDGSGKLLSVDAPNVPADTPSSSDEQSR